MLFSAVVPGAGQAYNESYWKVPIVLGFGAYFSYHWLDNHRLYRDYRDLYQQSLASGTPNENYRRVREFYKDQRDTFTWYLAILYVLNVVDAYVDASLYDFDVGDDLAVRALPRGGLQVQFRFHF